jgi:Fe-S-cluster containining protein
MDETNPCQDCIGVNGNECCFDVFIILNPFEEKLFENFEGFKKVKHGAIFYTKNGCPYLNKNKKCSIHNEKPLYCHYYPIFITGDIYVDTECPAHGLECFKLTPKIKKSLLKLQGEFPIYKKDWFYSDVLKVYGL